ncbi:hypothetical protein D9M68_630550 [compost metagenome]
MDEEHAHAFVARSDHGALEQARAIAAATGVRRHGHAEFGAVAVLVAGRVGHVRHRDQVEAAVVDAEQFITVEVQAFDIAQDLFVGRGIAEAQVAVVWRQVQQVARDAFAFARADRADRHHDGWGRADGARLRLNHRRLQERAEAERRFEEGLGGKHGSNVRVFP